MNYRPRSSRKSLAFPRCRLARRLTFRNEETRYKCIQKGKEEEKELEVSKSKISSILPRDSNYRGTKKRWPLDARLARCNSLPIFLPSYIYFFHPILD